MFAFWKKRQGVKITSLEEIADRQGFIGDAELEKAVATLCKAAYARYLRQLLSA
ncbi:hypothetical protein [Sphingobium sp. R-21]|uniref:hypothetical protein n=1 Tax=Sphingobium sp. R-21 TaxID=3404056 RepID=UPI003CF8F32F